MLTRHLYESDEVIGALRYCILQGRVIEMSFWIQELLESDLYIEAYRSLLDIWLLFFSGQIPQWIDHAISGESNLHELGMNLALCPDRDITPIAVLALQTEVVDRVKVNEGGGGYKMGLEDYYITALIQHRARSAWWATHGLGEERAWNILEDIYDGKYREHIQHIRRFAIEDSILLCGAICYICLVRKVRAIENQWHTKSVDMEKHAESWARCTSLRQRRVYSIPISSVCGYGTRWSLAKSDTTMGRLNNLEETVRTDHQGYWWNRFKSAGLNMETGEWSSDDAKEAFYSSTFSPEDDIPDEWPLADKKKSHGSGMLRTADESITGGRWARFWLPARSFQRGAWGLENKVQCAFTDMKVYTDLVKQPFWSCPDIERHVQPVLRKYVTDE
jgi:hypothetical protein